MIYGYVYHVRHLVENESSFCQDAATEIWNEISQLRTVNQTRARRQYTAPEGIYPSIYLKIRVF